MTSINSNSIDPLGVSQGAATHQHLVNIERNGLAAIPKLKSSKELVNELIFFVALDLSLIEVDEHIFVSLSKFKHAFVSLLMLKVCLSIKILGLDVADSFWR